MKEPKYFERVKDKENWNGYSFIPIDINEVRKLAQIDAFLKCKYVILQRQFAKDPIKEVLKEIDRLHKLIISSPE